MESSFPYVDSDTDSKTRKQVAKGDRASRGPSSGLRRRGSVSVGNAAAKGDATDEPLCLPAWALAGPGGWLL